MKFTIFTPTYNRAHLLPQLYTSLVKQTYQDFEWLIIDDGSTDNTETLIQQYSSEKRITIRYYKQENQGKHIAINRALEEARGEFLITVDSDDYIVENCVETCLTLSKEIEGKLDFAGFTYIHTSPNSTFDKSQYGKKRWTKLGDYEWEFKGEMAFVFRTEIAKKHPFPVYKDEKFCQEAVFLLPILNQYKILFTDHVLAHGDYLEDGLSQNIYRRLLANPRYAMLSYGMKIKSYGTAKEKTQMAKSYWDIALKAKHIPMVRKIKGIPLRYTLKVFWDKIKGKI